MPGGLHPPIEVILAWPSPNYHNPETRPDTITILACVLGTITLGMLLARLWLRAFHQKHPGWDDWIMLAATVPTLALTVIYPLAVRMGFNKHIWDIDRISGPNNVVRLRKFVLASECIFCIASGLIKISILLFYRRISNLVVSNTFRRITWLSILFIVGYSIALTLAPVLGCQPMSAFWDQFNATKIMQGYEFHCFDEGADVFAASVISTAQDLVTALLPALLYWNLRISIQQKVAIFGVFAVGYAGVAIGAARAYYSWRTFYETYDVTWATWDLMLTSLLELHIGAFCANAPAFKAFINYIRYERSSSRLPTQTSYHPYDYNDDNSIESPSYVATKKMFGMFIKLLPKSSLSHTPVDRVPELHITVPVSAHGGVQCQGRVRIASSFHSFSKTRGFRNARYASMIAEYIDYSQYFDDIELGSYTTAEHSLNSSWRSSRAEELKNDAQVEPVLAVPMDATEFFEYSAPFQSILTDDSCELPTYMELAGARGPHEG